MSCAEFYTFRKDFWEILTISRHQRPKTVDNKLHLHTLETTHREISSLQCENQHFSCQLITLKHSLFKAVTDFANLRYQLYFID